MELENDTMIDVEAEAIDTPNCKSIQQWYSACQLQSMLDMNKASLQKTIAKLQAIYGVPLELLRRGNARATEYSRLALEAIELLNSQKFTELRALIDEVSYSPPPTPTAIVFVENHNQIAASAATVADANLGQICSLKAGLLSNYRELGRSLGRQAAAEVREGFTEEVKVGLENLQKS